jgi:hypothetical protein
VNVNIGPKHECLTTGIISSICCDRLACLTGLLVRARAEGADAGKKEVFLVSSQLVTLYLKILLFAFYNNVVVKEWLLLLLFLLLLAVATHSVGPGFKAVNFNGFF